MFRVAAGAAGILTTSKLNPLQWPSMRAMPLSLMWIPNFRTTADFMDMGGGGGTTDVDSEAHFELASKN